MNNGEFWSIPEGYEVYDASLDDIKYNLNPKFDKEMVLSIEKNQIKSRALDGTEYIPGCLGLNNIIQTDYINVIVQSLSSISKIRNFMLLYEDEFEYKTNPYGALVLRFAELIRKIWNRQNFNGRVSPHEFCQAVAYASDKKFIIKKKSDPFQFLQWLLNSMHSFISSRNSNSNLIISDTFRGEIRTKKFIPFNTDQIKSQIVAKGQIKENLKFKEEIEVTPFWILRLDLPQVSIYKHELEKNSIPQIQLEELLRKFDGERPTTEPISCVKKVYSITKFPLSIIFHVNRFVKNSYFIEKNNTIISMPLVGLDLSKINPSFEISNKNNQNQIYDLSSIIIHDGKPGAGTYRCYVRNKAHMKWFEIMDLQIVEVLPQTVSLTEAYILFYEQVFQSAK